VSGRGGGAQGELAEGESRAAPTKHECVLRHQRFEHLGKGGYDSKTLQSKKAKNESCGSKSTAGTKMMSWNEGAEMVHGRARGVKGRGNVKNPGTRR